MKQETLRESAVLSVDPNSTDKGIWRAFLIAADVQGSSGFYPADVLERDGASAFPTGTHVYFDHPTVGEETERPERSVLDLAGYLIDDAAFEENEDGRGLFSRIQFTESARHLVSQIAKVVGLSIRAAGQIEETPSGERIVRQISEGLSVDVVTRAGAGGRLVAMTESATLESPPANQAGASSAESAASTNHVPSTLGSGDLRNEVIALKESLQDRIEQFSVDLARNTEQLRETRREAEKQTRENAKLAEAITFLRERAETAEQKMKESKRNGDMFAELLKSGLPVPSMVRIAESIRPEDDVHEKITLERDYTKKLMRESERSTLEHRESSGQLGLTESVTTSYSSSSSSDSDLNEVRDLLQGGTY